MPPSPIPNSPQQPCVCHGGCGWELVANALSALIYPFRVASSLQYHDVSVRALSVELCHLRHGSLESPEVAASIRCVLIAKRLKISYVTNRFLNSLLSPLPIALPPSRHMSSSPPAPNCHERLSQRSLQISQEAPNPRPFFSRVPQSKRSPRSQTKKRALPATPIGRSSTRLYLGYPFTDHRSAV